MHKKGDLYIMKQLYIFSDASVIATDSKKRESLTKRMEQDNRTPIFTVAAYSAFLGVILEGDNEKEINLKEDNTEIYDEQYILTGSAFNISSTEAEVLGLSLGLFAIPDLSEYDLKIYIDADHIMSVLHNLLHDKPSKAKLEEQIKKIFSKLQEAKSYEITHVASHKDTYYNNMVDGISYELASSLYNERIYPYLT